MDSKNVLVEADLQIITVLAFASLLITIGITFYQLIECFVMKRLVNNRSHARLILPPTIVYSFMSLDENGNLTQAEEQIRIAIEQALSDGKQMGHLVLFLDIIATQEQIGSGQALSLARQIIEHMRVRYPDLTDRIIGISDNDKVCTAREVLITGNLALSDVDNVHQFLIA